MKKIIQKTISYWYVPLILGLLFIALSIWVFSTPVETFLTLAVIFSAGFIVSGLLEIIYAIANREKLKNWGWYLAGGILSLVLGIHLVLRPELSALILSLYIGFWLLFRSAMQISVAMELKGSGKKNWGWVLTLGILGMIFSLILLWNPVVAGLTVAFWTGMGLISLGAVSIVMAFTIKNVRDYLEDRETGHYKED